MKYEANDIVSLSQGRAYRDKIGYSKYIIFDDGRVYSKSSNKFLKVFEKSTGYWAINLYNDNGIASMFFIHRLVAELFIPNPKNKPEVNHIDEDKSNNTKENLYWCSTSENEQHGTKKQRELETKTRNGAPNGRKAILQYTLNGKFVAEWPSLTSASKTLSIPIGNISRVLSGKRNHAGGYVWKTKK